MAQKGQTEIIGLMVIVILFIVILMFYIAVKLRPEIKTPLKESVQSSYMLNAILLYMPDCGSESAKLIKEIIQRCDFDANNNICGKPCKKLIEDNAKNIINLANNKYGYNFEITKRDKKVLSYNTRCDAKTITKISNNQPISGGVIVNLDICILK